MNIGHVIKRERQKWNMTQAELAAMLDITPQAVSRWEMGISYPDIAMIPKISEVLQVTADELLDIKPSNADGEADKNYEASLNQSLIDIVFDYVPAPVSGKSKKVLIVDDADFMRMMLVDILTRHGGHTILQAKNGQECLDILQNEVVDVCVLDIMMPVMDGIETLRIIKERLPELKVVMLTAVAGRSIVEQALKLGADAYVAKPFAVECLVERIG